MVTSTRPSTANIYPALRRRTTTLPDRLRTPSPSDNCSGSFLVSFNDDSFPVRSMEVFPDCAYAGFDAPRSIQPVAAFSHGQQNVSAVTVDNGNRRIFTGGKGSFKVWDMTRTLQPKSADGTGELMPLSDIQCLGGDGMIRACKCVPNNTNIVIVGGQSDSLAVCDLEQQSLQNVSLGSLMCNALAVASDSCVLFAACCDGSVKQIDLRTHEIVRQFTSHVDTTSIDISRDGRNIWTGNADAVLKKWDIREAITMNSCEFASPITALACCPTDDWIAVGQLASGFVLHERLFRTEWYCHVLHESRISSTKFSSSGRWFVTAGEDGLVAGWRTPHGGNIFQQRDVSRATLSCDISTDDKYIVTGGASPKAKLYECRF